jgi:putative ATP-dependent endonuclease of OLD family
VIHRRLAAQFLVVVEGDNEFEFLRRASAILRAENDALPDLSQLERRGRIVFVPFGGDPRNWVFRFAELGRPEFHLFDRGVPPATEIRREWARIINLRPGCRAAILSKRSIENYLHWDAILEARGVKVRFSDDDHVADLVAEPSFLRRHPSERWNELSARTR